MTAPTIQTIPDSVVQIVRNFAIEQVKKGIREIPKSEVDRLTDAVQQELERVEQALKSLGVTHGEKIMNVRDIIPDLLYSSNYPLGFDGVYRLYE